MRTAALAQTWAGGGEGGVAAARGTEKKKRPDGLKSKYYSDHRSSGLTKNMSHWEDKSVQREGGSRKAKKGELNIKRTILCRRFRPVGDDQANLGKIEVSGQNGKREGKEGGQSAIRGLRYRSERKKG